MRGKYIFFMKTVLIVNPWIYDFAAYDLWMKPWGLLKLSAILKREGFKVFLADTMDRHHRMFTEKVLDKPDGTGKFHAEEVEKPQILKDIPRRYKRYGLPPELFELSLPDEKIDAVLVSSGMTYWYPGVFEAIRIIKKRYKAPVILGGIYATLSHEHALNNSGADYVIKNGEYARLSGALGVKGELSFASILDETTDLSFYSSNPYAVLRVSLGCPFSCSYCAQKLLGPSFMLKSMDKAMDEIRGFYEQGIKNFAFYDDALLFDNEYAQRYLKNIIEEGIKADFYSPNGLHARFLSENIASLMKKVNFKSPILSLETANDERGRAWHEKITRAEFSEAVKNLIRSGYEAGEYTAYLMLGAPGSSSEEVEESMDFVNSLGCRISLSEFSPISGTVMAGMTGNEKMDPLLENNSIFSFFSPYRSRKAQKLKDKANALNLCFDKERSR